MPTLGVWVGLTLLALWPCICVAAPETIVPVPVSIDLPDACDQRISRTAIAAGTPTAVSVSPTTGHCWFGAFSIACCDSYYWYGESPDWVVADFPTKTDRIGWCGSCDLSPDADRCEDYVIPNAVFSYAHPGFREPAAIQVSPTDGTVWVAEPAQIMRLDSAGQVMWRAWDYVNPKSLSLDTRDGSCWVADTDNNAVVHLNGSGATMWRGTSFALPNSVSVNQSDGSVWIADTGNSEVVHLSVGGAELWRGSPATYPVAVAVNSVDGSCWIGDPLAGQVIHLGSGGAELHRISLTNPRTLAVNTAHSDVWVGGDWIAHLEGDGSLRAVYPITAAPAISVNNRDSSAWVADYEGNQVVHLYPACSPFSDVDCWFWAVNEIVGCYNADLVQGYREVNSLGEDITNYHPERIITRDQMAVYIARALAGGDGSVPPPPFELHFSDLLWSGWATKYIEYCYAQNVVQGYDDGTYRSDVPVNRAQMAVYIARSIVEPRGEEGLADWTAPSHATFPDVDAAFWSYKHVEYCAANAVVKGFTDGKYHPELEVPRDQMAVYIYRAFDVPTPGASVLP